MITPRASSHLGDEQFSIMESLLLAWHTSCNPCCKSLAVIYSCRGVVHVPSRAFAFDGRLGCHSCSEGSSPAVLAGRLTRIVNNSDRKQDRQFIVIVFTVFCTLHPSTLCNRSPSTVFFFQGPTPFTRVCFGSDMDRPLSGWGHVLVLGPNSMKCRRYSRFVADLGTEESGELSSTKLTVACKNALSARSGKTKRYRNVIWCSLKIPPSSPGRSLSIAESDGVNSSMCSPHPPTPTHSVCFVQASAPNGHGMVVFPSCSKFHCFCNFRGLFVPCGACAACGDKTFGL